MQIRRENNHKFQSEVDIAQNGYSVGEFLVISEGNSKPDEDLVLDTTCTFYMCLNWDSLSTYEVVSKGIVVMSNNTSCKIVGIRRIRTRMFDGTITTLDEVMHVPDLKRNLIFFSTFDSKRY